MHVGWHYREWSDASASAAVHMDDCSLFARPSIVALIYSFLATATANVYAGVDAAFETTPAAAPPPPPTVVVAIPGPRAAELLLFTAKTNT